MVGTEFLKGQGLGNQLFCYVTARSIAIDLGMQFGTAGQQNFANNIHERNGMYFMNIDLGIQIDDISSFNKYYEKEDRIYVPNSKHDIKYGCYISGMDKDIMQINDNTLVYGNLQAEDYFLDHSSDIKNWIKIKEEYDSYEYYQEHLCIMNMRGGEYIGNSELFIKKKYWINAMKHMKKIDCNMKFMIITDDIISANLMFQNIPAFHFNIAKDYATVKNAKYLILSNSSFAVFPALTSNTIEYLIAPKYWARYNVSNGYWASEQNIYSGWHYLDRNGLLYDAHQCKKELYQFKKSKSFTKKFIKKEKFTLLIYLFVAKCKLCKSKLSIFNIKRKLKHIV